MALSTLKNLIRRSIRTHQISSSVTASRVVIWANEFLTDVMPPLQRKDALAISYRDGTLKIVTQGGATIHYLRGFDDEFKHRFMEKFHEMKLTQIVYFVDRNLLIESV